MTAGSVTTEVVLTALMHAQADEYSSRLGQFDAAAVTEDSEDDDSEEDDSEEDDSADDDVTVDKVLHLPRRTLLSSLLRGWVGTTVVVIVWSRVVV